MMTTIDSQATLAEFQRQLQHSWQEFLHQFHQQQEEMRDELRAQREMRLRITNQLLEMGDKFRKKSEPVVGEPVVSLPDSQRPTLEGIFEQKALVVECDNGSPTINKEGDEEEQKKLKHYDNENLEDVTLVEDSNNIGMNCGYAFLEFSSRPEAMDAFRRLQRRDVLFGVDRPGLQNSCNGAVKLMEAESALCWRVMCKQLHAEAQEKGFDVAAMMGSEAAVHAAEALNCNDLLVNKLPSTVSDYISLVKAHVDDGTNNRFVTRQLLLVGTMLDFFDATNRNTAATFLRTLLQRLPECEVDDNGNVVALVDSINHCNAESMDAVTDFHSLKLSDIEDLNNGVLSLLYASLYGEDRTEAGTDEEESVIYVLLSDKYPSLSTSSQITLLVRLLSLFFGDETKDCDFVSFDTHDAAENFAYRGGRPREYESLSGSKRPYSVLDDALRYTYPAVCPSRARVDTPSNSNIKSDDGDSNFFWDPGGFTILYSRTSSTLRGMDWSKWRMFVSENVVNSLRTSYTLRGMECHVLNLGTEMNKIVSWVVTNKRRKRWETVSCC